MKPARLADIREGDEAIIEVMVDMKTVDAFASLSGDFSAIHVDDAFAQSKGFRGRIVHGVLLASYISQVLGMHLPGKNGVLQSLDIQFRKPVYMDSVLRIAAKVDKITKAVGLISIKITVHVGDELKATAKAQSIVRE